jgi:hypothetical protein
LTDPCSPLYNAAISKGEYGEMSERLKEHDWKSCVRPQRCTAGSNPALSAIEHRGVRSPDPQKGKIAGSRATSVCEPRQIRKEAAAAVTGVCCGKPGYPFFPLVLQEC